MTAQVRMQPKVQVCFRVADLQRHPGGPESGGAMACLMPAPVHALTAGMLCYAVV